MSNHKRRLRKAEVERTGHIPAGTDLHHKHLRNPSIAYLCRIISETEQLISSGKCHKEWGQKRLIALRKMLESKERRLEKRQMVK